MRHRFARRGHRPGRHCETSTPQSCAGFFLDRPQAPHHSGDRSTSGSGGRRAAAAGGSLKNNEWPQHPRRRCGADGAAQRRGDGPRTGHPRGDTPWSRSDGAGRVGVGRPHVGCRNGAVVRTAPSPGTAAHVMEARRPGSRSGHCRMRARLVAEADFAAANPPAFLRVGEESRPSADPLARADVLTPRCSAARPGRRPDRTAGWNGLALRRPHQTRRGRADRGAL